MVAHQEVVAVSFARHMYIYIYIVRGSADPCQQSLIELSLDISTKG